MNALPASIEASLGDAGFSGTEILVIRRLMEQDELSIRALSSGTGKGMGAVDQAVKKLIKKEIISKVWINDNYKYVFRSLDAVSKWVVEDLKKKRDALQRKHQDFETFISTLKMDKRRPEMEYYHGPDGIQKLYLQLLDAGKEQLDFLPVTVDPEEDPLRDFRSEYAKSRRSRGITLRVITNDTPFGRRFETRDPFEHRKTVLIPPDQYQFDFEKIITGDTVTCINHVEKRGCTIHYPELASMERSMFESLWKLNTKVPVTAEVVETAGANPPPQPLPEAPPPAEVLLKNKVASRVREFLWSKESLINFGVFFVIAAAVTFGVYKYDQYTNFQRLREKVVSIAATGALQFEARDLDQIHTPQDIVKPEYAKVIKQLNDIRYQNQWVKYMYIWRPTSQKNIFEFVVDADSIDPFTKEDENGDGKINEADENIAPGTPYDVSKIPVLQSGKYARPISSDIAYTDQWGTFISGFAPIKNADGRVVAVLGIDIFANQVQELTMSRYSLSGTFFGLFFLFILIRLTAFNRMLMQQVWQLLKETKWPVYAGFGGLFLVSLVFFYFYTSALNLQRIKEQALSIALTGANQFSANDLNQLQVEEDWKKPEWAKSVIALQNIRDSNEDIKYAYIFRKDPNDPKRLLFISDATSIDPYANVDANPDNDVDLDQNGEVTSVDFLPWPGQPWPEPTPEAFMAFDKPVVTSGIFTDQWGPVVSGYAPIKDKNGITVAVLAIDIWADKLERLNANTFGPPLLLVLLAFVVFILAKLAISNRDFLKKAWQILGLTSWIVYVSFFGLFLISVITFYFYTSYLNLERMKEQVLSIARTGASQFDVNDLNQLQAEEDWKKPEWGRVVSQLKEIRLNNADIKFTYIFRKDPKDSTKILFVSDSHSMNPYANSDNDPDNNQDTNGDGNIDVQDLLQWPGQQYPDPPAETVAAFNEPVTSARIYTDQWGEFLTGYAPIKDNKGITVAVLAIDVRPEKLQRLNASTIGVPLLIVFVAFFLFVIIKLAHFRRDFLSLAWRAFEIRRVLISLAFTAELAFFVTLGLYYYTLHATKEEIGKRLMSIAATAAPEFSVDDINQLHFARDMKTDAYQKIFKKLNEIRDQNTGIKFAYIYRVVKNPDLWEFVADADSNYNLPFYTDFNSDGILEESDENVAPGVRYYAWQKEIYKNVLDFPTYNSSIATAQWGLAISGTAPIRDKQGKAVAFVGVDIEITNTYKLIKNKFVFWLCFTALSIILIFTVALSKKIT